MFNYSAGTRRVEQNAPRPLLAPGRERYRAHDYLLERRATSVPVCSESLQLFVQMIAGRVVKREDVPRK